MPTNLTLRNYQEEMLTQLHKAWRQHRSVMVQMPTGTGKTVVLAEEIKSRTTHLNNRKTIKPQNVLVVAHRRELIEQIKKQCAMNDAEQVVVESIQKISKAKPDSAIFNLHFSLIIIDEAHHALAKTYRLLWERWSKAQFLGLTATPCRLNGAAFTDLFDVLLQSWSIQEFIDKGFLSDFEYVSARPDSNIMRQIRSLKKRGADGDFQTKEMATVMDVPESIEHLYDTYRSFAWGRKGIVYAIDRQHAGHIAAFYQERGAKCCVIDSKTPAKEREQMVEDYREGKLDVLVNVDIFSEGFDCPEVEFIQLARPTLSLSKYLQQVGRGMRVSEGKPHVLILDNVGLYQTFGLPTDARNWQQMFLGKETGKGQSDLSRCVVVNDDEQEKELVNLEMVRIKGGGERYAGLEVFVQGSRYGVMYNGKITCPAQFKKIERLEKGCGFFALGTYRKPNQHNYGKLIDVTTVIDKKGKDLGVKLYGRVRWTGSYFLGEDFNGSYRSVICWDPVGNSYYEDMEPEFKKVGGVEVAFAHEHDNWYASCLRLRYSTGHVSPRFDWQEIFYNHDIIIARDYLVVKKDHNHAYRICGYLGDSVLVQHEGQYGYLQFFRDGKPGELFSRMPQGTTPVLVPNRLGLQRAMKNEEPLKQTT